MTHFQVGEFRVEPELNTIGRNGAAARVEPKVMQVLVCLAQQPGGVISKEQLIKTVWADTFVTDDVLTRSISELRKVFGDDSREPRFIQTIPRNGYRLIAPVVNEESLEPKGEPVAAVTTLPNAGPKKYSLNYLLLSVLAVSLFATIGVFYISRSTPQAGAFARVVPFTSYPGSEDQAALSPDGNQIAFVWGGDDGKNIDIYLKSIAGGQALRLTTDPGIDLNPTWSPDGQKICFIRLVGADKKAMLFITSVLGTIPERSLGELYERGSSLSWSPDGKFIALSEAAKDGRPVIMLLSPESGERRELSTVPSNYWGDSSPSFSPDGSTVAFVRENTPITGDIYTVSIKGGDVHRVTNDNAQHTFGYGVSGGLTWTEDGSSLIFCSTRGGTPGLWKIPIAGGEPERLGISGDNAFRPTVSQRGHRLAYTQMYGGTQVYTVGLANSKEYGPQKFLDSTRDDTSPQFSPDGKRVAFESDRSGTHEIWMCDRDGRNLVQLTSFGKGFAGTPRWAPDSRNIAFDYRGTDNADVYVVNTNDAIAHRVTSEPSDDSVPSWSSDGRSIFFASNRTGSQQIWRIPAEGGTATQVTKEGGFTSFASGDGKYLFYTKSPVDTGVWRKSLDKDDETIVLREAGAGMWGRWQLSGNAIYFVTWSADNHFGVEMFDLNTKTLSKRTDLSNADERIGGFAVSPDGNQFLYTLQNSLKSDIMLVENFH